MCLLNYNDIYICQTIMSAKHLCLSNIYVTQMGIHISIVQNHVCQSKRVYMSVRQKGNSYISIMYVSLKGGSCLSTQKGINMCQSNKEFMSVCLKGSSCLSIQRGIHILYQLI